MKIGKNKIQGIYKYVPGCHPTQDDLILYNGYLWVCLTDNPSGAPGDNPISGETSSDYVLYQSPNIATEEEVLTLLRTEDSEWPDKAIPMSALEPILSSIYHGLTKTGIIKESDPVGISKIISDKNVSHGIFAFSRDHSDVAGLVPTDILGSSDTYKSPVFLKKYTYDLDSVRYVLLELNDYENGLLWYKCCTDIKSDTDYKVVSGWKLVAATKDLKRCAETIINRYRARLESLKGLEGKLKDNFRFTKLTFPEDQSRSKKIFTSGQESHGSSTTYPVLPNGLDLDYTIVILIKNIETGVYYSESVTIPVSLGSINIGVPFSVLSEEVKLTVSTSGAGKIEFGLQGVPSGYEAEICSIYYQDFYDHGE